MSDLWTSPSGEEEAASERRALWGLVVLVAIGVLVGLLMVFLGQAPPGRGGVGAGGVAPSSSASQPAVGTFTTRGHTSTASSTPTVCIDDRPAEAELPGWPLPATGPSWSRAMTSARPRLSASGPLTAVRRCP